MIDTLVEQLARLCAPPGAGWAASSSGMAPLASPLHQRLFNTDDPALVRVAWLAELREASPRSAILGVPYDGGTYGLSGASAGPLGIRLANDGWPDGTLDLGDVRYLPGLPTDDLLSQTALSAIREARFGAPSGDDPVCMLSVCRHLARLAVESGIPLVVLGGDHSVSAAAIAAHAPRNLALVHLDAHADLSTGRDGLSLLHSSWVHAADREHPFALVAQVGVFPEDVRPSWIASRLYRMSLEELREIAGNGLDRLFAALQCARSDGVYLSVDIDLIDQSEAPATGLPAHRGATSADVVRLIASLAERFDIVGADLTEVAPPLGSTSDWSAEATCRTAARVTSAMLEAVGIGCPP
jgi:arginase family enzyme